MIFRREQLGAAGAGAGAPSDPYFENVTLLLHGDGTNGGQNNTFIDSSTNNFTITRNGNTTQGSFSPYGNLWSNYFNDSSSTYLNFGAQSALQFTTQNFTIEFWINPSKTSPTGMVCGTWQTSVNAFFWGVFVGGGVVAFSYSENGTYQGANDPKVAASISVGVWTHVAIVRNGTNLTLYLNGVASSTSNSMTNINPGGGQFWVGTNAPSQGQPFFGYLSNLRIINSAYYTSNFTPPTTPLTAVSGTILLTCQSNRFCDNSSNAFSVTVNGTPTVQRYSPFSPSDAYSTSVIGGSAYFDGSGDELYAPNNTALALGSSDFTIECWLYTGNTSSKQDIADRRSSAALQGWFLTMNLGGAGLIRFYADISGGGGWPLFTSNTAIAANTWTHVALVRNGSSFKLYLNGVEDASATNSNAISDVSTSLYVGGGPDATRFNGYISNFRLVKGTALYTSNFTPPTAPLTAITNTSLLLNFTNAGIYDNAMMNDLETVGNAQISTSVKKYGTGSIYTPTSAYLINQNANINLGSANFTIEFWLNSSSDEGGYPGLVAVDSGLTGDYAGLVITKAGVFVTFNGSSWGIFAASLGTINDGTWRHIAVVRSGASLYCFNNGVLQSTTSIASAIFDKGPALIVGKKADNFNTGTSYIDDIRITNGIARYTSNFTPPSAAFPNT